MLGLLPGWLGDDDAGVFINDDAGAVAGNEDGHQAATSNSGAEAGAGGVKPLSMRVGIHKTVVNVLFEVVIARDRGGNFQREWRPDGKLFERVFGTLAQPILIGPYIPTGFMK